MKTLKEIVLELEASAEKKRRADEGESARKAANTAAAQLATLRAQVSDLLMAELDGEFDFVVRLSYSSSGRIGAICRLDAAGQPRGVAAVCVLYESHRFMDKHPTVEIYELCVTLSDIVNGARLITATSLDDFRAKLAEWVVAKRRG